MKNSVSSLINTNVQIDGISVRHIFTLTMTTKSTNTCYVYGIFSKDFNNLSLSLEKEIKPEALKFGLSVLHARIRFLESILHLAHKLPNKKIKNKRLKMKIQ